MDELDADDEDFIPDEANRKDPLENIGKKNRKDPPEKTGKKLQGNWSSWDYCQHEVKVKQWLFQ